MWRKWTPREEMVKKTTCDLCVRTPHMFHTWRDGETVRRFFLTGVRCISVRYTLKFFTDFFHNWLLQTGKICFFFSLRLRRDVRVMDGKIFFFINNENAICIFGFVRWRATQNEDDVFFILSSRKKQSIFSHFSRCESSHWILIVCHLS